MKKSTQQYLRAIQYIFFLISFCMFVMFMAHVWKYRVPVGNYKHLIIIAPLFASVAFSLHAFIDHTPAPPPPSDSFNAVMTSNKKQQVNSAKPKQSASAKPKKSASVQPKPFVKTKPKPVFRKLMYHATPTKEAALEIYNNNLWVNNCSLYPGLHFGDLGTASPYGSWLIKAEISCAIDRVSNDEKDTSASLIQLRDAGHNDFHYFIPCKQTTANQRLKPAIVKPIKIFNKGGSNV